MPSEDAGDFGSAKGAFWGKEQRGWKFVTDDCRWG